ncbi:hypothetical protein MHYP_G00187390 [Metynnis hypsauchen]
MCCFYTWNIFFAALTRLTQTDLPIQTPLMLTLTLLTVTLPLPSAASPDLHTVSIRSPGPPTEPPPGTTCFWNRASASACYVSFCITSTSEPALIHTGDSNTAAFRAAFKQF